MFLELDLKDKDKKMIMETVVHAADISNPCKPWNLCKDWTVRIVSEFFDQVLLIVNLMY